MQNYLKLVRQVRDEFARSPKSTGIWDDGNSLAGRRIYRPLGILFAPFFIALSMSANQVTLLSFVVGMAGMGLFMLGQPSLFLAGALGYFLFAVLDFADGLVARHQGKSTHYGKMLDHMSGSIVTSVAPLFVGFGVVRAGLVPAWAGSEQLYLLLAALSSVVNLVGKELAANFALECARVTKASSDPDPATQDADSGLLYLARRAVFHASSTTTHLVLIAVTLAGVTYIFPLLFLALAVAKLVMVLARILRTGSRILAVDKA